MKKLQNCIELVFDEDYDHIASVQTFLETGNWDSLKYMELVIALQAEFGIELSQEEILKITSVAAIVDVLKSKGIEL